MNWPEQARQAMGFAPEFAEKNLVEVIYPVFEGKVYRLDLETGRQTKPPMEGTGGFKGTGSIDPRGYPLLYSGQGLQDINGTLVGWRYRIFDLIQNKEVAGWTGSDPAAPRKDWGAFDSSALVNAASDTLIEPAENGLVYKVKLNAAFDPAAKTVSVDPQLTKLEYKTPRSSKHGIESSAVAYRNLMFASDNDGNLICWDANTLTVLWARDIGDDSDATMVLEETPRASSSITATPSTSVGRPATNTPTCARSTPSPVRSSGSTTWPPATTRPSTAACWPPRCSARERSPTWSSSTSPRPPAPRPAPWSRSTS
ncbi:MAG: hypothetical protein IPL43_11050 [Micropruina sp.]|nr:hypothetical protein [Micropruina sp.]